MLLALYCVAAVETQLLRNQDSCASCQGGHCPRPPSRASGDCSKGHRASALGKRGISAAGPVYMLQMAQLQALLPAFGG